MKIQKIEILCPKCEHGMAVIVKADTYLITTCVNLDCNPEGKVQYHISITVFKVNIP